MAESERTATIAASIPAEAFAKLTGRHRDVLNLLARDGLESKEIAAVLGIEKTTVDGYFREINRLLGVSRRKDAARLFAEHERLSLGSAPHSMRGQPVRVSESPVLDEPVDGGRDNDRFNPERVSEVPGIGWGPPPRPDHWWNRRNELSPLVRLLIILGLMIGGMIVAALVVPVTDGIQRAASSFTSKL